MECALIRMKAKTLPKIMEALPGLDHGRFGYCSKCGKAEGGLRALPFAVRCAASHTPWRTFRGTHGPDRVNK